MLEKSSWSHSSNGGFPTSLDGDTMRMPSPCVRSTNMKSCDNAHILGDQTFDVDKNVQQYEQNDSSCTESGLTFLGNGLQDKGNNDLMFYAWPELENFDDVDDMFRGCDSTFGLDIDNSDHLSWLLTSPTVEGSNDALMSSFDIPICNPCCPSTVTDEQENKVEGQEDKSESHVIPSKYQNQIEGRTRDQSSENGVSLIQIDKLRKTVESNHLSNARSDLLCVKNTIPAKENKDEGQNKADGRDTGFSGELDSCGSENKETSCMSSVLHEFLIDAGSLKQLQHVMVQLDIRTKLCIRDSLYRLARSAAQRHNCDNHNSVKDDKDGTGALL